MATTRDYIGYLNENIEIAPANSQEELLAAESIQRIMEEHGLETALQEFDAPASGDLPHRILMLVLFLGVFLSGLQGTPAATIGIILVAICAILFLLAFFGIDVLANIGPRARSQNVIGVHRAEGPLAGRGNRPIVVVAHYDTPRESFLYSTPLARIQNALKRLVPVFVLVACLLGIFQVIGIIPGAVRRIVWVIGIVASIPLLVLGIEGIYSRVSGCTDGANDNKSGVAAMLGVLSLVRPQRDSADGYGRAVSRDLEDLRAERAQEATPVAGPEAQQLEPADETLGDTGVYGEASLSEQRDMARETARAAAAESFARGNSGIINALVPTVESEAKDELDDTTPEAVAVAAYRATGTGAAVAVAAYAAAGSDDDAEREPLDQEAEEPAPLEGDVAAAQEAPQDAEADQAPAAEPEQDEPEGDEPQQVQPAREPVDEGPAYEQGAQEQDVVAEAQAAPRRTEDIPDFLLPNTPAPAPSYESVPATASAGEPVPQVVTERYEKVEGIRHGRDVLADLRMLPTSCEIVYVKPQLVSRSVRPQIAAETNEPAYQTAAGRNGAFDLISHDSAVQPVVSDVYGDEAQYETNDELAKQGSGGFSRVLAVISNFFGRIKVFFVSIPARISSLRAKKGESAEYDDAQGYVEDQAPVEEYVYVEESVDSPRANERAEEAEPVERVQQLDDSELLDFGGEGDDEEFEPAPKRKLRLPKLPHFGRNRKEAVEPSNTAEFEAQPETREELDIYALETDGNQDPRYYESRTYVEERPAREPAPAPVVVEHAPKPAPAPEPAPEVVEPAPEVAEPARDESTLAPGIKFEEEPDPTPEEISLRDVSGLDAEVHIEPDVSKPLPVEERPRPAQVDDPSWGTSEYHPQSTSNFGRRAALFDLPDPSAASSDPFDSGSFPATAASGQQARTAEEMEDTAVNTQMTNNERERARRRIALLGNDKPKAKDSDSQSMSEWLGVGDDFDAKRDGAAIGSWENFEDDGKGTRWKGGATSRMGLWEEGQGEQVPADQQDTGEMPVAVAPEQLREAILSMGDEELIAHDIWFVALGASELDHAGMRSFLAENRMHFRGAFLVNLDSVGAGELTAFTREGLFASRRTDRRIERVLTNVFEDLHIPLMKRTHEHGDTDATPAMRASVRAITITGLSEDGVPALSHTVDDVIEGIDPAQVTAVADAVAELIRRS